MVCVLFTRCLAFLDFGVLGCFFLFGLGDKYCYDFFLGLQIQDYVGLPTKSYRHPVPPRRETSRILV